MNVALAETDAPRLSTAHISYLAAGDTGTGVPVVMLHGIGSNASSFSRLLPLAARTARAVAWDAPGYGDSAPLDADWPDAQDYAAALRTFLDDLAIDRAVVIGHSLGAIMAARFAARYPERTAALALLSPATGYGAEKGEALPPAQQARIDELEALGGAEFARRRAPRLVYQPERQTAVYAAVERAMSEVRPRGYAQAVRLLATADIFGDVEKLSALPVMVAVGAEDVVAPPEKARALFAALEREGHSGVRQFHLFAGCGHALPQEDPDALWGKLSEFIETYGNTGVTPDV